MSRILTAALAVALTAMGGFSTMESAGAQDYPNKPIRIISPFPPGGGNDIVARIMADALSPKLGQQVIVENRPGASGMIGSEYVAKAPPDGYLLLSAAVDALTMIPALKKDMAYEVEKFTFLAKISENAMAVTISSQLPAKNFAEFIAYAKANPGKVRYGTNGVGAAAHLATELFMKQTGTKLSHVAYKGMANAMSDLLGGHIDFVPLTPVAIAPHITSDKLRIIGFTAMERHPSMPNVPTLKELGFPYATVTVWYGLVGPGNMPAAVTERLRKEITAVLADPAIREKLTKAGSTVAPVIGEDYRKLVIDEINQWREIAKAENIAYPNQ
jgi:tripartite-type tricarboxylate transporter receptor subunit TctC